jgi:hypothetical protein
MRHVIVGLGLIAGLLCGARAKASPDGDEDALWPLPRVSASVGLHVGSARLATDATAIGGVVGGQANLLVHFPRFTLGVIAGVGTESIFGVWDAFVGLQAGPAWNVGRWRLQLLGEAGAHRIGGIGHNLFIGTTPSDVGALLPALGLGFSALWRHPMFWSFDWFLMPSLLSRFDLRRKTVQFTTADCLLTCTPRTSTQATLGGGEVELSLNVGVLF